MLDEDLIFQVQPVELLDWCNVALLGTIPPQIHFVGCFNQDFRSV